MLEAVCVARLMTWDSESYSEPVKAFSFKTLKNFYKQIPCSFATPYFLCCLINTKRSPSLGTGTDTARSERHQRQIRRACVWIHTHIHTHQTEYRQVSIHKLQTETQGQKWRIQIWAWSLSNRTNGKFASLWHNVTWIHFHAHSEVIFNALTNAHNPSKGHLESFWWFFILMFKKLIIDIHTQD